MKRRSWGEVQLGTPASRSAWLTGAGRAPLPWPFEAAPFPLDRGAQAGEVVLHDVILGARLHRLGRQVFVDAARHDKERNVKAVVFQKIQRRGGAESGHIVIGDHHIPFLAGQRHFHGGAAIDPLIQNRFVPSFL